MLNDMMNKKKIFKILLWIVVALLFVSLLRSTNLSEIVGGLKSITIPMLLLLAGLQLLTQFLLNYQWCHIASAMGLKTPFWKMFYINCKGTITESITPGSKIGGEVVRGYLFKTEFDCSTADAASLVAIQKIISVGSLILLNLAALMFLPSSIIFLTPFFKFLLFGIMIFVLAIFILLLFRPQLISNRIAVFHFKNKTFQKIQAGVIEFSEHAHKVRNGKTLLFQLILSVFIWALFPFKLVLLAGQYRDGLNLLALLGATLTAYFVAMIPISPGGLGVFEVMLSSMLIMLGLTSEQALITAVVFRFFTFWFVILYSMIVIFIYNAAAKIKKNSDSKKESVSIECSESDF